jgi:hypothetical protein
MKIFIIYILLFFSVNLYAKKVKFYFSRWNEKGNTWLDVPSDMYSYFNKGELYYFISNDNTNIYIDIKIENSGVYNRILNEGLIVWINMDSKLTRKMGIRFPIGSKNSISGKEPHISSGKLNADGTLVAILTQANKIELIGFKNEEIRQIPAENADNFSGSLKYDKEGILHYKMLLPIAKLPVRNSKDGDGAMPFSFGIEYGPLPLKNTSRGNMAPPPLTPPSGGVRGRSSREGGQSSGAAGKHLQGSGNQGTGIAAPQNAPTPVLLWIKNIKLATDK